MAILSLSPQARRRSFPVFDGASRSPVRRATTAESLITRIFGTDGTLDRRGQLKTTVIRPRLDDNIAN